MTTARDVIAANVDRGDDPYEVADNVIAALLSADYRIIPRPQYEALVALREKAKELADAAERDMKLNRYGDYDGGGGWWSLKTEDAICEVRVALRAAGIQIEGPKS
jgi:hypothetical protein